MGDQSKKIARAADLARHMDELNAPPRRLIRCRCCKKSEREGFGIVDVGGTPLWDECIEAAAQIIAERKVGQ